MLQPRITSALTNKKTDTARRNLFMWHTPPQGKIELGKPTGNLGIHITCKRLPAADTPRADLRARAPQRDGGLPAAKVRGKYPAAPTPGRWREASRGRAP